MPCRHSVSAFDSACKNTVLLPPSDEDGWRTHQHSGSSVAMYMKRGLVPVCTNQPDTYCPPARSRTFGATTFSPATLKTPATHNDLGLTWAKEVSSHDARGRPGQPAPGRPANHRSRVGAIVGVEHWVWKGWQRRLRAIQPHWSVRVEGVLVHAAHALPFHVHGNINESRVSPSRSPAATTEDIDTELWLASW